MPEQLAPALNRAEHRWTQTFAHAQNCRNQNCDQKPGRAVTTMSFEMPTSYRIAMTAWILGMSPRQLIP